MGKFKGILKKVTGTLKYALGVLPIVSALGGILTFAGLGIGTSLYSNKIYDDFKGTDYYIERAEEGYKEAYIQYNNGEIDNAQLKEKLDYYHNKKGLKEIIEEGGEETDEFKGKVKNIENCVIGIITVGALTVVGIGSCLVANYGHDFIEDLFDSAKADFSYKSINDPPKPPKPLKVKKKKEKQEAEVIMELQSKDCEKACDENGFEYDSEELNDIDEYLKKLDNYIQ